MGKLTRKTTDGEFAKVLADPGVSIVDFWAEWCGPCRTLGPHVDALAEEYEGKVSVYKLDVDANPETPAKYHIRGLPTVLIIKNGAVVSRAFPRRSFHH